MKNKLTFDKLVVKVPGNKLPKILDLSTLDKHTRMAIMKAYNNSTVYAPNLTATKSEKLSAAMASNLAIFKEEISHIESPSAADKASAFCAAFEFDSVTTPNIVRLIQSIPLKDYKYVDIEALIGILYYDCHVSVQSPELYAEFQSWKYYQMIKDSVGGVSVVKFMRFYIGVLQNI